MTVTDLDAYRKAKTQEAKRDAGKRRMLQSLSEPTSNFYRISHLTTQHRAFKDMSIYARLLWYTLCSHRNRYQRGKAYFTRSYRQLSQDTGFSVNRVRTARQELIDNRFIVSAARPGGRTRWQILDVKDIRTVSQG